MIGGLCMGCSQRLHPCLNLSNHSSHNIQVQEDHQLHTKDHPAGILNLPWYDCYLLYVDISQQFSDELLYYI